MTLKHFKKVEDIWLKKDLPTKVERVQVSHIREFHKSYGREGLPLIIEGMEKVKFDANQFIELASKRFADLPIKARFNTYVQPSDYHPAKRTYVDLTWKDYIETISNDNPANLEYAGNQQVPLALLEALAIEPPVFYRAEMYEKPSLWCGPKGSLTPLHRDSSDNFAMHIFGRKKWILFPPSDNQYLYIDPISGGGGEFAASQIDLRSVNKNKFPLFEKAHSLAVEVRGGEVLYLPMGWLRWPHLTGHSVK